MYTVRRRRADDLEGGAPRNVQGADPHQYRTSYTYDAAGRLLTKTDPLGHRSILVTYLVPALALGYGALLLGEEITVVAVGGLALVLGGVALGTGAVRAQRRARVSADTLAP